MWASHYGHEEVVKLLMAAGADIHAQNDVRERICFLQATDKFNFSRYYPDRMGTLRSCQQRTKADWVL
jgi:hypothetical protein